MAREIEVVVGDYQSKNTESLLAQCQRVKSDYDGFLHSGIIHYVQGRMDFTLKAAISEILDKCPSIWPLDLPERIAKDEPLEITKEMEKEFERLNRELLLPVGGYEIGEVIRLAKQFLAKCGVSN